VTGSYFRCTDEKANLFNHTEKTAELSVGCGKVEIQNQDSHFSTTPSACGSKEKSVPKKHANPKNRLHKILDTAEMGLSV
jgi:hypothetical protein